MKIEILNMKPETLKPSSLLVGKAVHVIVGRPRRFHLCILGGSVAITRIL